MDTVETLNKEYAKLCQILGDLYIKRDKLDLAISDIKKSIDGLNEAVGAFKSIQKVQQEQLKKDLEQSASHAIFPKPEPV